MKKTIVVLLLALVALMGLCYFFIPPVIVIDKSVIVNNNLRSAYRCFSENSNWPKWWPEKTTEKRLILDGNTYLVKYKTASSVFVDIHNTSLTVPSSFTFIPGGKNEIKLNWVANFPATNNPIKRLQFYFSAKKIAGQIEKLLKNMSDFGSSTANLYALDIRRELVKDSAVVSILDSSIGFPSAEKIYALVHPLREYVKIQHAVVTDSPMINLLTTDKDHYQLKVALPTNRPLPSNGKIEYRWMLPGGNILVADVKGGQQSIDSAFAIIENYVEDHELKAPAIPFYSYITNRLAEKDSTKWITRIYYPVMYYYD